MRRWFLRDSTVLAVVCLMSLFAAPLSAINIVMNYNAAASNEPTGDPTGALLIGIMQHIESTYEDVFEDGHTITLNFWYEDLPAPARGDHDLVTQSGGRETVGNIRFDPDAQGAGYFFDPTPGDDSEYSLSQTLWRNLTPAQQADFFNVGGAIPRTYEVGWGGPRNASNPATLGRSDLLSVAFHEVGHSLGMSAANNSTAAETGDGDYDFDAINLFGQALAAECADGTLGANTNVAHLNSTFGLMDPGIGLDVRQRPSHTDLLAMAAVHNYAALDLPRREFYGGTSWNDDANWSGNTVPGAADDVFVRAAGPNGESRLASLGGNAAALNVFIREGGDVDVNNFQLLASDNVEVDGAGSSLILNAGGAVQTDVVTIQNGASLSNDGGTVTAGLIRNNSLITGDGTLSASVGLINNGTMNVSVGALTLIGVLDLDGDGLINETGAINVLPVSSDLIVTSALTDNFNGDLTIGPSNAATFNQPWTIGGVPGGSIVLGRDGVLNLNGGTNSATAALLGGAGVTVIGDVNVATGSFGRITSDATFSAANGGAQVDVAGALILEGTSMYFGGSHTGAGTLVWEGDVVVNGNTTINVTNLDADGNVPGGSAIVINQGVTLTVNSTLFDPLTVPLTINAGTLAMNTPWTLDGSATLNGSAAFAGIRGSSLTLAGGRINSVLNGFLQAPVVFNNGTINVVSGFFESESSLTTPVNGRITKTGNGAWIISGPQSHAAGANLLVNAGAVFLNSDVGATGANLDMTVNAAGTVIASSSQHFDGVAIVGGMAVDAQGNTNVLRARSLEILENGVLDLRDENLIVDHSGSSPFNSIRSLIDSGHNNGSWNGAGIRSQNAAVDPTNRAIGYAEASALFTSFPATFAGESIDATTVLARFTVVGDANLDRIVNIGDFSRLASRFNQPGVWSDGDFNYNLTVEIGDFALLSAHFNTALPRLAATSTVPEPSAVFVLVPLLFLQPRTRPWAANCS